MARCEKQTILSRHREISSIGKREREKSEVAVDCLFMFEKERLRWRTKPKFLSGVLLLVKSYSSTTVMRVLESERSDLAPQSDLWGLWVFGRC